MSCTFDVIASAAAFALLLGAWSAVYVTVAPADHPAHRRAIAMQVRP